MSTPIQEVRALLRQFERSHLKDLYLRSQDWAVFMARPEGAANPMLGQAQQPAAGTALRRERMPAQHLGLFEPSCAVGDHVEAQAVLGQIDVLGRKTQVVSEAAGRIATLAPAAQLVEYGDTLVELEVAV